MATSESAPAVLVVDDEASNRAVVERVLSRGGYQVKGAGGAAEALRIIDEHGTFALYILDVMMPEVLGTRLAQCIRDIDADARIIYFTAFSNGLLDEVEGRRREIVLEKPVSNRDLLAAVSRMLFGHNRGPGRVR
jgi:two-component system cell cycle sensor histidine kinase/response regulator CckA